MILSIKHRSTGKVLFEDLSEADLSGANLSEADLSEVSGLEGVKGDFWSVLIRAPKEVSGLIAALKEGRVDGSQYQGTCACLVGTIANLRHEFYTSLTNGLTPNPSRLSEKWFLAIRKGDTPETSPICKLTVVWAEEFQQLMAAAVKTKADND